MTTILQPVCFNPDCKLHQLYCQSDRLSFTFEKDGRTFVIIRIPVNFANERQGAYCEECHFKLLGGK